MTSQTTPGSGPEIRSGVTSGAKPDMESEATARQKAARRGLREYLGPAFRPRVLLTGPIIYSLIIPFAIIDLWVTLYQRLAFPAYGIPLVRRRDFVVIDRHKLGYLNAWEKLNCVYCGYSNGVANYVRAVSARTEMYWCPIQHATPVEGVHDDYELYVPYGDDANWRRRTWDVRRRVKGIAQRKAADPRLSMSVEERRNLDPK